MRTTVSICDTAVVREEKKERNEQTPVFVHTSVERGIGDTYL
jgi:hypothetical protein